VSNFSLRDKVALVTGGAQGIGHAIVAEFVRQGAKVVVVDNGTSIGGEVPGPASVLENLRVFGDNVLALTEDVAAADTAARAVSLAVQRFGAVDILVNNAAILRDAMIFKSERANWECVIAANLTGAWAMVAAATPVMRDAIKAQRAPGRIVNIISTAGLYGNFGQAAYASAKAGLVGLTRVTAMDMARSKVLCNAVAPFASTRVTESIQPANEAQAQYKKRALKIPAAYVAKLVAWLGSGGCGVSGQIFGVRGREVFLFSQPRPAARIVTKVLPELTLENLDAEISLQFREQFTDLSTDLEAFNTEPLV
jgi:NAD(P)-dependent dehydrogenase (short-subunit alcohol dehydrogenase family)